MKDSEKLLNEIQELLKEDEITTLFRKAGEDDMPYDTVNALLQGFGEECPEITVSFMFPDADPMLNTEMFSLMATVYEDITPLDAEELYLVISNVNAFIPVGGFSVYDGNLYFRASQLLPTDFDYDRKSEICEMCITLMLNACMRFTNELCKLASGKIAAADFEF